MSTVNRIIDAWRIYSYNVKLSATKPQFRVRSVALTFHRSCNSGEWMVMAVSDRCHIYKNVKSFRAMSLCGQRSHCVIIATSSAQKSFQMSNPFACWNESIRFFASSNVLLRCFHHTSSHASDIFELLGEMNNFVAIVYLSQFL